jgi:hypothetical protein
MKIHLVDEVCGSGKSTWMMGQIEEWNRNKTYEQFVYISPLLTEVGGDVVEGEYTSGRIQSSCPNLNFQYPKKVRGSKMQDVKSLIRKGSNIAATHALFRLVDDGCRGLLTETRNVLVIDEAVSAIEHFSGVSGQGLRTLLSGGQLIKGESGKLSWNHEKFPVMESNDGGKKFEYAELVELCDSGYAYVVSSVDDNGSHKNVVVLWQFPKELLECFDDVYVLTYLYNGSVMKSWAEMNGVEVERIRPPLYKSTKDVKEELKKLIINYDGRALQRIGNYTLSQSFWATASDDEVKDISDTISNLVKNRIAPEGIRVDDMLVTCPKSKWFKDVAKISKNKSELLATGKGYARATWVPSSCKATNLFVDKRCMVYMLNKYPHTFVASFCSMKGSKIDQDKFAIAEAIQAIFRTCIRKKEPEVLHLVMVSNRMRRLFNDWLNSEGVFEDE